MRGLCIAEPGLWALPDAAPQHWAFVQESLLDLGLALRSAGGTLSVDTGEACTVLERHWQAQPFDTVSDAVAQSLRQQAWITAVRQTLRVLASRWEVQGVDLDAADSPLLQ